MKKHERDIVEKALRMIKEDYKVVNIRGAGKGFGAVHPTAQRKPFMKNLGKSDVERAIEAENDGSEQIIDKEKVKVSKAFTNSTDDESLNEFKKLIKDYINVSQLHKKICK